MSVMEPEYIVEAPADQDEFEKILSADSSRAWENESFSLEMFGELECRKDDVFTFFSDGTFEYDGGADLCGDSDNTQIVNGTWEVNLEEGLIIFNRGMENEAQARYITVKENTLRVIGSWNSMEIDALYRNR